MTAGGDPAADARVPRYVVGLEEGTDGAFHVHALDLPGCVGSGSGRNEALGSFEDELVAWLTFLGAQGKPVPPQDRELEIVVEEWITTQADVSAGETVACFQSDGRPLSRSEISLGVETLGSLRGRLIPHIRRASDADLEAYVGAGFSARTILEELARAQWWTLTRLGASPLAAVPDQVVGRLDTALALAVDRLLNLSDERLGQALTLEGEEWTPRKVLRRLLWLEWSLGAAAIRTLDAHVSRVS
jgi:predicted RNase H-like HicB family nuclease